MRSDDVIEESPDPLAIETADAEGEFTLTLRGDLDLATSPSLDAALDRVDRRRQRIVVDMSGVGFMDSTGLRALWGLRQHVTAIHGQLYLRAPSDAVMRVLRTTKLDKVFDYAPHSGAG